MDSRYRVRMDNLQSTSYELYNKISSTARWVKISAVIEILILICLIILVIIAIIWAVRTYNVM